MKLSKYYPIEFEGITDKALILELKTYIVDVKKHCSQVMKKAKPRMRKE